MEAEALALAHGAEFSLWALFARATLTVKLVMIGLIVLSVWGWAVIINKHRLFRQARRESLDFEEAFWSGEPLDGLFEQVGPQPGGRTERIFAAGMTEWRRSHKNTGDLIAGAAGTTGAC